MFEGFQFPTILQTIFVVLFGKIIFFVIDVGKKLMSGDGLHEPNFKKDVVYLWQFPRNKYVPNVSPFCLKVESYLKLHNIAHKVRYSMTARSKHGLLPFIELNGKQIADSQLILIHLAKHFNIKDYSTPESEALGRTISIMLEKHTFFAIFKFKVVDNCTVFCQHMLSGVLGSGLDALFAPVMALVLKQQSIEKITKNLGMFENEDFMELIKRDLAVLQTSLGNKQFLTGDEPTAVDCCVLGVIGSSTYLPYETPVKTLLRNEFKAVNEYIDRVRDIVWGTEFEQRH